MQQRICVEGVIVNALDAAMGDPITPVDVDPAILALLLSPWPRVLAFVWGAVWGSFANVVIHRVPQGLSVLKPRSRCPACETPIASYDNIPIVSYLLLRGRCRKCRERFSPRYMIVELLSGVLSFALFIQYVHAPLVAGGGGTLILLGTWALLFIFGLALLVIVYIDLDWWIIPNSIVLPLTIVGIVVAGVAPDILGTTLLDAVLTAAVAYGFFAGMRWVWFRLRGIEGLGLGDAKLLMMVGAFVGWKATFWTVLAGAMQGLLVAVPMLLLGRNVANTDLQEVHGEDPELGEEDPDAGVMGQRVPFGPFLALAALEYVLLRPQIDGLLEWFFPGL